jgi:ATP-dependent DNA ligase
MVGGNNMSDQAIDFATFAASVGIMKPNKAKKDDEKAKKKLDLLLDSPEYAIEEKIDGCHYKLLGHRFFSTENVEKTDNFAHLRDFFKKLGMANLILDGEINYPGKTAQYCVHVTGAQPAGAKHFQELNGPIHFTVFDILRTPKANWTIRNTYKERRKLLEYFYATFVKGTEMENYIHVSEVRYDGKREYVQELLDVGLEGGVLKKLDSQYIMGKKPMWQWMKIKQEDDTDLVVMGFEPAKRLYTGKNLASWEYWEEDKGSREMVPVTKFHAMGWIGSVVLGAYIDGKLTRICTASGLDEKMRKDMTENPDTYIGKVARVEFMEKTSDGYPRHPHLKNMHEGKHPEECTWSF